MACHRRVLDMRNADVTQCQQLMLENLRPRSLLRRSPLDVRQLYTPVLLTSLNSAGSSEGLLQGLLSRLHFTCLQDSWQAPRHWPLRRTACGQLETLRPKLENSG